MKYPTIPSTAFAPSVLVLPAFYRQLEVENYWLMKNDSPASCVSFANLLSHFQWTEMAYPLDEILMVLEAYRIGTLGSTPFDINVLAPNSWGIETGLFTAIYHSKPSVAEWFLEHGADPSIEPVRRQGYYPPRYITTHVLKRAMKNGLPFSLIDKLLACGAPTEPNRDAFFRKNIFEFVLVDCRHLHTVFMTGYMKCLLATPAVPSAYTVDTLYMTLQEGTSTVYPAEVIYEILGQLMWRMDRETIMAARIQRYWRSFKLKKTVVSLQRAYRAKIWHPDHVWTNGKTTLDKLFGGLHKKQKCECC